MCFVWIWEQTAIISLYSINRLVFITETECLLRGTDWVFIHNSTFCPHSVFVCFVWFWEQTAIISLYSINWLVFITERECLLPGTDWTCNLGETLPQCRGAVAGLNTETGFDPWPLQESLWCTKGSERGFSPRTLVSPCYWHSPTLHHNTTIVRRTSERAWEPFNRGVLFHVLGRNALRLFLAAKCCGRWHRVVNP